jgi:hypothetical protein
VVAVAAAGDNDNHSLFLKADGTVVARGSNNKGQCNVSDLTGVVAVAAGWQYSLFLKADGTVVARGHPYNGSGPTGVVALDARFFNCQFLKTDCSVVGVSDLTGVVAIAAGEFHTLFLKSDGTVVARGDNYEGQCNVSDLTAVVGVAAGHVHSLFLMGDGSVVARGPNYDGLCNVSDLTGVVAMAGGRYHSLFLKADGSVVARGPNTFGNCEVPAGVAFALPPAARITPVSSAHPGKPVSLDGSGSTDLDNNVPLTYSWQIASKPTGSNPTLTNPTSVSPTFTPDPNILGDYKVMLVVRDAMGIFSNPTWATISTQNTAPVADAGPDQAVTVIGRTVSLNALTPTQASYDSDGDPLTFQWSFVSWPGSTDDPPPDHPALTGANTATPSFVPGVHGTYQLQLVVSDPYASCETPSYVTVSLENIKPVAHAATGTPSVVVGETVNLDGSASSDANLDPLTYQWTLTTKPASSQVGTDLGVFSTASFAPDFPGTYVTQLVVNDGVINSESDSVTILAITTPEKLIQDIQALQTLIAGLAPTDFKNANMQKALLNKTNAAIKGIAAGNYQEARDQLKDDILGKTDGCQGDSEGTPDKNDWIISPEAQASLYPGLVQLIAEMEEAFF